MLRPVPQDTRVAGLPVRVGPAKTYFSDVISSPRHIGNNSPGLVAWVYSRPLDEEDLEEIIRPIQEGPPPGYENTLARVHPLTGAGATPAQSDLALFVVRFVAVCGMNCQQFC
jgi:hypothetical protein